MAVASHIDATIKMHVLCCRRTELDYGLGKREEGRNVEHILVVAEQPCLSRLAAAAETAAEHAAAAANSGADGVGMAAEGGCWIEVVVDGWNEGVAVEQQKVLESYWQLQPQVEIKQGARAA